MGKLHLNKRTPMLDKAGVVLAKAGKSIKGLVTDRHFQIGVMTTVLPSAVTAAIQIRKYKRQAEEKNKLYKTALAKHNAVIKELDAMADMNNERQDRLLAYDTKLKEEMRGLQSEIQELKGQIAELEKKKANDE